MQIFLLMKKHFFSLVLDCKKPTEQTWVSDLYPALVAQHFNLETPCRGHSDLRQEGHLRLEDGLVVRIIKHKH